MKKSLKIPDRPIIRYLNDPDQFYQNNKTPTGGFRASHSPYKVSEFCKLEVLTPIRIDRYRVDIVVFGVPEDEGIYRARHEAWLNESKAYRRTMFDTEVAHTEPKRPRPHRPVRITYSLNIPWGTYRGADPPMDHATSKCLRVDGEVKGWSQAEIDRWAEEEASLFPEKAAAFIDEGLDFAMAAMSQFVKDNEKRYYHG